MNQLWIVVNAPQGKEGFFLQSLLGNNLVIDIDFTGRNKNEDPPLQLSTMDPNAESQLWKVGPTGVPSAGFFIVSVQNPGYVIDIKGGSTKKGSPLQLHFGKTINPLSPNGPAELTGAANQLWAMTDYWTPLGSGVVAGSDTNLKITP